jgi:hypothetical protein
MKRFFQTAAVAVLVSGTGCINFEESREMFCASVTPHNRALICEDGPQCVVLDPIKSAGGVPLDQRPSVTFNQAVSCDASGLRMVRNQVNEPPVAGSTVCSGQKATFTPESPLSLGTVYKVYVQETIVNAANTPALCPPWTFTTR